MLDSGALKQGTHPAFGVGSMEKHSMLCSRVERLRIACAWLSLAVVAACSSDPAAPAKPSTPSQAGAPAAAVGGTVLQPPAALPTAGTVSPDSKPSPAAGSGGTNALPEGKQVTLLHWGGLPETHGGDK